MINTKKAALRKHFRAVRAAISHEERKEKSLGVCRVLWEELPEFSTARTILFYYPLPHEIDILPLFDRARKLGIRCAFPRCRAEAGEMDFFYVDDLSELENGRFGIREPKLSAQRVEDFSDTLMLVPAMAFDRQGFRLGYGGGYYDRFLAAHPMKTVGITYELLLAEALPRDEYDKAVDIIATERRMIRITAFSPQY